MPESHESSECRGRPAVEFSADPQRLDHDRVHALLAEHASWALGRTRGQQDAIIAHSRNYGMYLTESGEQVAYARVVTDMVTFAWLADVIVDPAFGRRGIGGALIEGVLADLRPLGLKRVVLKASDQGRPLYERAGWHGLDGVDDWMELRP
jgi:GNAT superfamily N-acetyltransferase